MVILLLLSFFIAFAEAKTDVCDIIDVPGCHGVTKQIRRASARSLPSPSTVASQNPSAVSFDRGLGVEMIHQNHNALNFGLATGTGKVGGAFISNSLENSFFGNRVPELDEDFLKRNLEDKQYRPRKYSLALATKLLNKKDYSLNAGVLLKRHDEIKRVNPGFGISGHLGPFTFGASFYQDDLFIDFTNKVQESTGIPYTYIYSKGSHRERYKVETYFVGTRIKALFLDAGVIKTQYKFTDDNVKIALYSAALQYKYLLFNLAVRKELSPTPGMLNKKLLYEEEKNETYVGVQASLNKYVIVGINYNYFLLRELSLSANLFF
jgi:hypothetical protein